MGAPDRDIAQAGDCIAPPGYRRHRPADSKKAFFGSSATPVRPRSWLRSVASAAASARAAASGEWPRRQHCSWTRSCRGSRSDSGCCRCPFLLRDLLTTQSEVVTQVLASSIERFRAT